MIIRRSRNGRSGFVLVTAVFATFFTILFMGLAVDLGRMFVVKRELQAFCDESAIAAAFELDGTTGGIASSRTVAATGPSGTSNRWDFATKTVSTPAVEFATAPTGPFAANPAPAGVRFVRVTASAGVSLPFAGILPGLRQGSVKATAVGGQFSRQELGDGLAPFSPDTHMAGDPNFGFHSGTRYTLKWAPTGQRDKPGGSCAGDVGFDPGGSSDRGYLDVGQGTGNSALYSAIVRNDYLLPNPLYVGGPMPMMIPGEKNTNEALTQRFLQDTDTTSARYSDYHGNGRRILTVAVNDHAPTNSRVAGFAAFFLPADACGSQNTDPCCAEYIGPAVFSSTRRGGSTSGGLYAVQLYE